VLCVRENKPRATSEQVSRNDKNEIKSPLNGTENGQYKLSEYCYEGAYSKAMGATSSHRTLISAMDAIATVMPFARKWLGQSSE